MEGINPILSAQRVKWLLTTEEKASGCCRKCTYEEACCQSKKDLGAGRQQPPSTFGRDRISTVRLHELSLRAMWYIVRKEQITCFVGYTTLAGKSSKGKIHCWSSATRSSDLGGWWGGLCALWCVKHGVPHREPSVLHVIVEAVAGDLGASQASSQLSGEGGGADEGKSSCLMSRMGVARGERQTARERHPKDGSVQSGE